EQRVYCNATHYCQDGNTCCRSVSGEWACCPLPNAVCCSDRIHCCPNGYTCTSTSCQKESHVTEFFKKEPAIQAQRVYCNATHYCPDGNTCCRSVSGEWACCPLPIAVCCSDRIHCCPNGYTCTSTSCQKGSHVTEFFKKEPAIQAQRVYCNATHYCPDGNTCCISVSGEWACCPLPIAVCCSDRIHCCPNGYTCTSTSCQKGSHVTEFFKKEPTIQEQRVYCNATHYCQDGNTCCRSVSGEWACCPLPNAVCCSDRIHCCPNGYTCTSTSCQKRSHVTEFFKEEPAIQAKQTLKNK
ncbi:Hypothetical predicted protein, partial [Paramuricea clavata]